MKRNAGFTLIELIIVIVILGILAVTAAPKFINLQNDARASTVNGLKGAVQAAASMTYSKAIIAGQDKSTGQSTFTINGSNIALTNGYPSATSAGIGLVIDASSADWTGTGTGPYYLTPVGMTSGSSATCVVTYTAPAASGSAPTVVANTTGC